MKKIAIIPARSGSKGLKDKNIKLLNGKPLMAYSIEAAIKSNQFDKIFVSTDSKEYAEIGKAYGADVSFLRSEAMSSDTAGTWDTVREVLSEFDKRGEHYDIVMLLQPTSPLRSHEDIINAFAIMCEKNADAIESVTEMDHSPLWCNTLPEDGNMKGFEKAEVVNVPRQQLPVYYRLNGAIYLLKREELDKEIMFNDNCFAYIMDKRKSIDIDDSLDFCLAEILMEKE